MLYKTCLLGVGSFCNNFKSGSQMLLNSTMFYALWIAFSVIFQLKKIYGLLSFCAVLVSNVCSEIKIKIPFSFYG
jgi:hypothetical protein